MLHFTFEFQTFDPAFALVVCYEGREAWNNDGQHNNEGGVSSVWSKLLLPQEMLLLSNKHCLFHR